MCLFLRVLHIGTYLEHVSTPEVYFIQTSCQQYRLTYLSSVIITKIYAEAAPGSMLKF